jgi:hypothetical protein
MKEHTGQTVIATLILNLGTSWRLVVKFMPSATTPLGKEPPVNIE